MNATTHTTDSNYAWFRLAVSLVLAVIGGIGLWPAVVVLPTLQKDFGITGPAPRSPTPS